MNTVFIELIIPVGGSSYDRHASFGPLIASNPFIFDACLPNRQSNRQSNRQFNRQFNRQYNRQLYKQSDFWKVAFLIKYEMK